MKRLPRQHVVHRLEREFTAEESHRLRRGLLPRIMEDKWAIVLQQGVLRCARSWTQNCIFELPLEVRSDGSLRAAGELRINTDPDIVRERPTVEDFVELIECLVFCRGRPGASRAALSAWSHFGWGRNQDEIAADPHPFPFTVRAPDGRVVYPPSAGDAEAGGSPERRGE